MGISDYLGYIIALLVMAINLVPMIISLLIFWNGKSWSAKSWKYMIFTGLCIGIHSSFHFLLHKFLYGSWNFLRTVRRVISFDFTYQDIASFPFSLLARTILAFVIGCFFRYISNVYRDRSRRLPRKRITALYALFSLVGIVATSTLYFSFSGVQNLVINEVGSNNVSVILDDQGTVCDYVELYNKGDLACAVEELYLSDNENDLKKKMISGSVIPARGYMVVKLEDNNLRIRKEGGDTVFFSNIWGSVIDQVLTVSVEGDFAYCRVEDASDCWEMRSATPGETNGNGVARLGEVPRLSHSSGFYEDAFDLQIFAEEGTTIYYTLDGSVPTMESEKYTQPIRVYNRSAEPNVWRSQQRVVMEWESYTPDLTLVDKAFVVRAVAIDESGAVSKPVTATYFVGLEEYQQGSVVSLVVDPEDFWGENGIHVTGKKYDAWYQGDRKDNAPTANFRKWGRGWEKPAYFQYLSDDKTFEQEIGIRVAGGSSRSNVKKSFSLYSREIYSGNNVFETDIFEGIQSEKLAIRGGYANAICQMLVPDRNFGTQQVQRVAVFLNGEFWYNANILEKYDSRYFYEHYGVNPNNVVTMQEHELDEGVTGDELLLNEIYDYLSTHDLSDGASYAGFLELVDIQSYIDYMCFNIYIDNMDFKEDKNSLWWRSREVTSKPYEDGKWRFVAYDLDAMEWNDAEVWGMESQAAKNTFVLMPRYADIINQQPLFAALKKNPAFVKQFVLTFMDLVNANFRYENVQAVLDNYGPAGNNYHSGNGGTQELGYYETFFQTRPAYIVPYLAEEFSLTGTLESLHLGISNADAGYVRLNTITPDLSQGDWCGQYYTDFPVTVTAVAAEGYVFKGWSGSVSSAEESLEVKLSTGGTTLYAVFEKETP